MALEDIEIKNADDVETGIKSLISEGLFGDLSAQSDSEEVVEQKVSDEAQSENNTEEEKEDSDIPNASIRLDKMRKQRDDDRDKVSALENQLSELKGMLNVMNNKEEESVDEDPTQYMDETQKSLYEKHEILTKKYAELEKSVGKIETDKVQESLLKEENLFFDNNPNLKAKQQELVDGMYVYLKAKPDIAQLLADRKLTVNEIYGMYEASRPKSSTKTQVKSPDKVFSGHSGSVPSEKTVDMANNRKKALSILNDPNSTNKADAVNYGINSFAENLLS